MKPTGEERLAVALILVIFALIVVLVVAFRFFSISHQRFIEHAAFVTPIGQAFSPPDRCQV